MWRSGSCFPLSKLYVPIPHSHQFPEAFRSLVTMLQGKHSGSPSDWHPGMWMIDLRHRDYHSLHSMQGFAMLWTVDHSYEFPSGILYAMWEGPTAHEKERKHRKTADIQTSKNIQN